LTAGLIGWAGSEINRKLRLTFMGFAWFFVLFGFWYLWESIFVIGALCIYCVACYGAVLAISAAWLRQNHSDIQIVAVKRIVNRLINDNLDIVIWVAIALIIVFEAIIKFVN
jgi:hypothetical protein